MGMANASLLDEATAAAEAMTLLRRLNRKAHRRPVHRRRRHPPPDPRRGGHPGRAAGHRSRRRRFGAGRYRGDRRRGVRRAGVIPRQLGSHRRPERDHRRRPQRQRHGGGGHRPAGDVSAHPSGRVGGRRSGGIVAAFRGAAWIRGPPCRIHRGAGISHAVAARPTCRRIDRRCRGGGLPADPPDPGAAHPPRAGHQQHLHRPSPLGGDGRHVCRLPRTRWAGPDRPTGPPPDSHRGRPTAPFRLRDRRRALLRHRNRPVCRVEPPRSWPPRWPRDSTCVQSTTTPSGSRWTRPPPGPRWLPCGGLSALPPIPADFDALDAETPDALPTRGRPVERIPELIPTFHRYHSETEMLRYSAPPGLQRPGPRPNHDPAGVVHHEAQRHHPDGAGELARIRPDASVRPR